MEAETEVSCDIPISKVAEDKHTKADPIKKEEEDTSFDGEFIKVEKETIESKDVAHAAASENAASPPSGSIEQSSDLSSASREFLESQEKVRELEAELERVTLSLKDSESQNAELNDELSLTKEKLGQIGKKYEKLEINHDKLQEKIAEEEGRYSSQLSALQDAIHAREVKHGELESVKEDLQTKIMELESTTEKKNVELEDLLRASKAQLVESESRFIAAEQRNVELEHKLNLVELKSSDAERELREISEKISELHVTLEKVTEEKSHLNAQVQEFQDKISQFESDSDQVAARNSELEQELKGALEKCGEYEDRVNITDQCSRELEDLMEISHSKAEEASKRASELELLLETEKYRIQELEEQISALEKKCKDSAAESNQYCNKASELEEELKAFQSKVLSYETALESATEKEKELSECLNVTTEDKRTLEDAYRNSTERLAETENLLGVLRNELNITQQKISETDDRAAEIMSENEMLTATNVQLKKRINDVEELLNSASTDKEASSQQLAYHMNTITELADKHARASEMQLAAESRISETEKMLEESIQNVAKKDLEAKDLMERLNALRDQVKTYEEQAHETSSLAETLKVRLEQTLTTLRVQEGAAEELKRKSIDLEEERVRLLKANSELTEKLASYEPKVIDLETKLEAAFVERKELEEQLAVANAQLKQQKELDTEKEMERESSLKELHAKKNEVSLLESKIKEVEEKFQLADSRLKEKDVGGNSSDPKEDVEVKSRDIGSSKRKSKKKSEASATQTQVRSTTNEAASPFTPKFILGVALVSIIIGIVLGKRY